MRSLLCATAGLLAAVAFGITLSARAGGPSRASCIGADEPRCRASWHEQKQRDTSYDIRCEYACARGRDPWKAPDPACRCHPPCGRVYVKKKLYKSEGEETVERVPRYAVELAPPTGCGCTACRTDGPPSWDPLDILSLFGARGRP